MIDGVLDLPVSLTVTVEDAILVAACISQAHEAMPPGSVGDTKYEALNRSVIQVVSRAIVDRGFDSAEASKLLTEMNKSLAILAMPDR